MRSTHRRPAARSVRRRRRRAAASSRFAGRGPRACAGGSGASRRAGAPRARGPVTSSEPARRMSGQSSASRDPPARASASRRCPRRRRCRRARRAGSKAAAEPLPLGRVDDQPVDDADELVELVRAPGRLAAPAAEDGQVRDQERLHDRRGRLRPAALQTQLDDLRRDRPLRPLDFEADDVDGRVEAVLAPRLGTSRITVRDGCRSAMPASVCSACVEPRLRHPDQVRHHARGAAAPRPGARAPRSARSTRRRGVQARGRLSAAATTARRGAIRSSADGRPPRARLVVREARPVALPRGDDRVDERPLLVDLVRAREERRVAEHAVEDQPLVRLGQARRGTRRRRGSPCARCGSASPGPAPWRRSPARRPRPAGRGSGARSGAAPRRRSPRTAGAARAGTGSRSSSRAARAACPMPDVEGRVGPAPVVDVELRGDERLRHRVRRDALLLAVAGNLDALDVAAAVLAANDRLRARACAASAAPSPSRSAPSRR